MSLPRLALGRPVATWMFFLGLSLMGLIALFHLPVDLMPDAGQGQLTVFIGIRGGLPPEDIETLVTKVVEDAVSSTPRLRQVISVSRKDRTVITLSFEPGTDLSFSALDVQERLAKIRNKLPREIEKPVVAHYSENDYPVIILALSSDKLTPEEIREEVDNGLKPLLARVDGVANIEVGGGRERKVLVEFDPFRLEAYQLPILQVIDQLGKNNLTLLSGKVERERDSYHVRTMGQFNTLDDIKKLTVLTTPQGSRVKLEDVAEVRDFFLPAQSHARLNKKPTVSVYVQKENNGNTLTVARRVRERLAEYKKTLDPAIQLTTVSDQSVFVADALKTVRSNLTSGALLTGIILFLFLRDWKHTLVIFVSIPLSVLMTFALMDLSGLSLDVMTLSGLALGIGMVVDASTVVLENIVHLKRRQQKRGGAVDWREATVAATDELNVSLVGSTLSTVVVFLPIIFINKQVRMLYSGLALTVTYSLVAALLVAVTAVPLLASRLPLPEEERGWWQRGMESVKRRLSRWPIAADVFRRPRAHFLSLCGGVFRAQKKILMGLGLAVLLCGVIFVRFMNKEFLGSSEPNEFVIFVELPSGTKLEISDQVVSEVEKVLSDTPEIAKVVKTAAARVEGWSSKVYVTLLPRGERARSVQDVINDLRPKVADLGQVYDTFIYFSEPESSKELLLDVFGNQYDKLRDMAVAMADRLQAVKGLADVKLRYKAGQPEVQIRLDKDRVAMAGFTVKEVAESLHAMVRGLRASYFYTATQQIEIVAMDQEKARKTLEDVQALSLVGRQGEIIPIRQLAEFDFALTPSEIWRKDKQRMIQVSANRERLALSKAADKARRALKGLTVPVGYYYQLGGDYVAMRQNEKEFSFAFLIMGLLVFLVLASLFESFTQPFLIMLTIPLALLGSIPLLFLTNTSVTMGVYIGTILLGGIVVNNAIILVDQMNLDRSRGTGLLRAALKGPWSRLSPIMNTTLTTLVGLLPMIWSKSESAQLWAPLAMTVVGGLAVSTVLTLFLVPALYYTLEKFKELKGLTRRSV